MQIKKLLLTLLTLVCVVVGASAKTLTFDFTSSTEKPGLTSGSYPSTEKTVPIEGVSDTGDKISTNFVFFKCGWSKSSSNSFLNLPKASGTEAYFKIEAPEGFAITGFKFYTTNASVSLAGSAELFSDDKLVETLTQPSKGTWSKFFDLSASQAKNNIKIHNAIANQFSLGKIEITIVPAVDPVDVMAEWDQVGTEAAPYVIDVNDAAKVYPAFTAVGQNGTTEFAENKVSYTSSNPEVLTVDAATGAMTAVTAGTTTVTAAFAGDMYFNAFAMPIVIQVTGKQDIQPVSVTPATTAELLPGAQITFNCATADSKLFYTVKQGETVVQTNAEGGVAMPFSYTFAAPGTYTVLCHAENPLYSNIAEQTLTYTVKPIIPTAPQFSVAAGEVDYKSVVSVSATDVETFEYTVAYPGKEKDDETLTAAATNGVFTFNVEYDCTVSVVAKGKWADSESVSRSYTVKRPAAPAFSLADMSQIEQGEYVTITAADGCTLRYQVNEGEVQNEASKTCNYQVVEDVMISAWSVLPNGYLSQSTDVLYEMVAPHTAGKPVASAPDGSAIKEVAEVEFTSAEADKMLLKAYAFDGTFTATEAKGNKIKANVTADVRRFVVQGVRNVYGDNDGGSELLDVTYKIGEYRLVSDASQLKEGMMFVLAVPQQSVLMSKNTTSQTGRFDKSAATLSPDSLQLTPVADDQLLLMLEKSTVEGEWYIKSLDAAQPGYLYQSGANTTSLFIGTKPVSTSVVFKTPTRVEIKFAAGGNTASVNTRCLMAHKTSSYFTTYQVLAGDKTETKDVISPAIYALQEAVPEQPVVTFRYRRYDWRGFFDPETEHATVPETDADGTITYSTQGIGNLAGDFKLFVNGTALGGHSDQAKTDFTMGHNDAEFNGVNCAGEHAPYVYVQQETPYNMVLAKEGTPFLPLSTSPDRYHYGNDVHTAPVVQLALKPYHKAVLTVKGEAGGSVTSVGNVSVDANEPVMLFNLQGQAVNADTAAPGIYVRRQGSRSEKVIIR